VIEVLDGPRRVASGRCGSDDAGAVRRLSTGSRDAAVAGVKPNPSSRVEISGGSAIAARSGLPAFSSCLRADRAFDDCFSRAKSEALPRNLSLRHTSAMAWRQPDLRPWIAVTSNEAAVLQPARHHPGLCCGCRCCRPCRAYRRQIQEICAAADRYRARCARRGKKVCSASSSLLPLCRRVRLFSRVTVKLQRRWQLDMGDG
jgi:hypothetical protein